MKDAKLMILNMVSEWKITAEDGAKLIEAISQEQSHNPGVVGVQGKPHGSTEPTDDLGAEIREKVKSIYKDVEPQFRKMLLSALETATLVTSAVHDSINESIRGGEAKTDEQ